MSFTAVLIYFRTHAHQLVFFACILQPLHCASCRLLGAFLPLVFRIPDCMTAPDDAHQWHLYGHVPDAATVNTVEESLGHLASLAAGAHHINLLGVELVPAYFVLLLQVCSWLLNSCILVVNDPLTCGHNIYMCTFPCARLCRLFTQRSVLTWRHFSF